MAMLWEEIKAAFHTLNRSRSFSWGAVVLLAVTIAVSSTAFSIPAALMLRPLPIFAPGRLIRVDAREFTSASPMSWSYPDFASFRNQSSSIFTGISNFSVEGVSWTDHGRIKLLAAANVAGDFFQTLGLNAYLGRTLMASDDTAANPTWVVVVSRTFWRQQLRSNPNAVGSMLHLNGHAFRLVGIVDGHGVLSSLIAQPQIFIPTHTAALISQGNALNQEGSRWIQTIFARLRPSVSRAQAQQRVDEVVMRLRKRGWWQPGLVLRLAPAGTFASFMPNVGAKILRQAQMAWLASLLVMLIVLANVASLLLVRALKRVRDQAVSMALGARWWQRALPGLAEGLVISVIAGVIGLLISVAASLWLAHWPAFAGKLPVLDWRVAIYALLLVVCTSLVYGFVPMLALDARRLTEYLAARPSETRGQGHLRSALVVVQVAISSALLIASLFVLRSLIALQQVNLGFDASRYLVAQLDFSDMVDKPQFDVPHGVLDTLRRAVDSVPGVTGASFSTKAPFDGRLFKNQVRVPGRALPVSTSYAAITDGYFHIMRMKILVGRSFRAFPHGEPNLVIINEALARRLFGSQIDLASRQTIRMEGRAYHIVGVVSNIRANNPAQPAGPYMYFRYPVQGGPYLQMTIASMSGQPKQILARAIGAALQHAMPQLLVGGIKPMRNILKHYYASREAIAKTLGIAGLVALIVVVLGIYAALSYDLALRRHAHAVWMALGARHAHVVGWSVRRSVTLLALGLIVGSVAGVYAMRFLQRYLYAVTLRDALLVLIVAGALLLVAVVSALVASRSARGLKVAELLHEL